MRTEKEFMPKIENIKTRYKLAKLKSIGKDIWDVITFLAYIKFYIFCFSMGLIVLVLSLFVLSEHGGDIERLGKAIQMTTYFTFVCLTIIIIDKWIEFSQKNSKANKK